MPKNPIKIKLNTKRGRPRKLSEADNEKMNARIEKFHKGKQNYLESAKDTYLNSVFYHTFPL